MGWTCTNKPVGQTVRAFLEPLYTQETDAWTQRVLDCAVVRREVAYLAVERVDKKTGEREVSAGVVLIKFYPRDPQFNFGYKDMDEGMGPYEVDCPARILDLLTPTTGAWALEWRRKCRERLAVEAAKPKVKKGTRIKFDRPIRFNSGCELDTFEWISGSSFRAIYPGGGRSAITYRISRWRERSYQLAEGA